MSKGVVQTLLRVFLNNDIIKSNIPKMKSGLLVGLLCSDSSLD